MEKQLHIPFSPICDGWTLQQVDALLAAQPAALLIDTVNWADYPYCPYAAVRVAYTHESLYLHFCVEEEGVRAVHTRDLEPVNEDDCVEFFVANAEGTRYWNFEFNAIGCCNASERISKTEGVRRLSCEERQSIERYASLGSQPISVREGLQRWTLGVRIPLPLLHILPAMLTDRPAPLVLRGNFYKCGDKTPCPHYLSWAPIASPVPAFHRPDCFAQLVFDKPITTK